jgi:hypothetical protein
VRVTYLKINFGLGPNAPRAGPGEILKFRPVKTSIFSDVAPCSVVEVYWRYRGAYCHHHRPDDGGSKHLWNVGKLLPDYMAQHLRRVIFRPINVSIRVLQTSYPTNERTYRSHSSSHVTKCYCGWILGQRNGNVRKTQPSHAVSLRLSIRPQQTQSR